jgi:hypothetical protein
MTNVVIGSSWMMKSSIQHGRNDGTARSMARSMSASMTCALGIAIPASEPTVR